VIGPYDDVPVAPDSAMFDYELEIAAARRRRESDDHLLRPAGDRASRLA
jgi:2-keto-4-pentenoate hydratase/2-oxohepta-3-ene-1,7-dioic acid hydratase in catechol pathway